ncbi:hypothetical protein KY366_03535 [Candidatus Woesearchaeota archaeon]|nr:hypothetical protein [Candidatus Woesearchaeota archaeon]
MEIKKAEKEELKRLIPVYKEFFPVHAIFTRSDEEVLDYLENLKGDILIAVEDNSVVGGLVIARKKYGHTVANFKHIAAKDGDKETIKELVKKAEELSDAAKIELNIADGEKIPYSFFEGLGYETEGKLKSHYRQGETCYILGKTKKEE